VSTGDAKWVTASPRTYWRVLPSVVYIKILNNSFVLINEDWIKWLADLGKDNIKF